MIQVSADMGPFMEATGVVEGIARAVETDIYVNYIVDDAANELRNEFQTKFLAAALSNPRAYHHVFEWGSLGYHGILQDSGLSTPVPLYKLTKRGRGSNKTVGFVFLQSRIQVPLPDAARSGIPQENIDRLKKEHRAVFRFKAYVMESGMSVHIQRRRAGALFVPVSGAENGFVFKQAITVTPGSGPGGGNVGRFTSFWETFWSTYAPQYMEDTVIKRIESNIDKIAEENLARIRRGRRVTTKSFNVASVSAGRRLAESRASMVENQMIRDAKREASMDNDWDEEE